MAAAYWKVIKIEGKDKSSLLAEWDKNSLIFFRENKTFHFIGDILETNVAWMDLEIIFKAAWLVIPARKLWKSGPDRAALKSHDEVDKK